MNNMLQARCKTVQTNTPFTRCKNDLDRNLDCDLDNYLDCDPEDVSVYTGHSLCKLGTRDATRLRFEI